MSAHHADPVVLVTQFYLICAPRPVIVEARPTMQIGGSARGRRQLVGHAR